MSANSRHIEIDFDIVRVNGPGIPATLKVIWRSARLSCLSAVLRLILGAIKIKRASCKSIFDRTSFYFGCTGVFKVPHTGCDADASYPHLKKGCAPKDTDAHRVTKDVWHLQPRPSEYIPSGMHITGPRLNLTHMRS